MKSNNSTLKGLNDYLLFERNLLEKSWDKLTCYPKMDISKRFHVSTGQCFVTSLILFFALKEYLQDFNTIFIYRGNTKDLAGNFIIRDHCWLEINFRDEIIIIDLTLDQSSNYNYPIICNSKEYIYTALGIAYNSEKTYFYDNIEDIENENTKQRFYRLLSNRNNYLRKLWSTCNTSTKVISITF